MGYGNRILTDEKYGYKKIDLDGNQEDLNNFYTEDYYKFNAKRYSEKQGKSKTIEKTEHIDDNDWMEETVYKRMCNTFEANIGELEKSILDIGCSGGSFVKYMKDKKWDAKGIEPSKSMYYRTLEKDIDVENLTLDKFHDLNTKKFSCLNMGNVLEHIKDPISAIKICKELMVENGILRIRVPNDFNKLQEISNRYVKDKEWWISDPDHVNYFNKDSVEKIMNDLGFEVIYKTVDFPMELFILMGENYVDNTDVGKECHEKRKRFEMNLDEATRVELYEKFYDMGIGRNIIVYGRLRSM